MSVYSCTTKTLQHEPNCKLLENWFKLYNIPFISLSHPCCIITFPPERVEITHFFSPIRSWTTQKELAHLLDSARNDARLPFMSAPGALLPLTGLNSRTCSSREEDHRSARSEDLQTFSKALAFILFE